ncbi:MAG: ATP-binding protein [Deferrisomatales bacterium]|nr:ATP-binding protein [Deferrisomatales bacterium]
MKRSTERSLLLAILLSSLIPVLALGLFTGAAVLRMGRQVEEISLRARLEQLHSDLHLRCLEKGEDLSRFLRGRGDDLRSLALLPPTPASYRSFYWSTLAPLTATGDEGHQERIWLPLYSEVGFIAPDGTEVVVVRDGEPVPAPQLRHHPDLVRTPPAAVTGHASLLPQVSIQPLPKEGPVPMSTEGQVSRAQEVQERPLAQDAQERPLPAAAGGAGATGAFDGSLALSLPVAGGEGRRPGTVRAVLNPRQLATRLGTPRGTAGHRGPTLSEARSVFFFRADGEPEVYPSLATDWERELPAVPPEQMATAVEAVRRGASGVLHTPPGGPRAALAYAPILSPAGPAEPPFPLGGVLVAVDLRTLAPAPATARAVASLTRDLELQIGVLSLASVLFVSLAALLVAQRMSRPWTRLREKAGEMGGSDPGDDEVGAISRSFDSLASQVAVHAGRLRASKRRLDEFIEMSPDGIAVTDPQGRILHCNRALCQMVRRTPTELTGQDVRRLWARSADWDEMLDRLRVAGRLKSYEGELRRGDGAAFPALLTLRLHGHGGDESIDLIARDISEWKEIQRRDRSKTETLFRVYGELSKAHQQLRGAYAEVEEQVHTKTAELRQAYDALQAADRVKTEFLMNMSHELRTPLNCIIGYSEAMIEGLDGPVSGEQAGSLERIADSGRRLLRLIENLLDLSRIEAGRMQILCVETRLEDAVEDVLHQARSLVGERPIRLEVSLDATLPPAWADPDRLRQVLFNLVGNALKFTERGAVQIHAGRLPGGGVEVRVSDTGPGIPAEHLDTIFERFAQLPGAKSSGAGLGLAICRELVESMGGRIRVESASGHGSTFAFTLATTQPSGQLTLPFPQGADSQPER